MSDETNTVETSEDLKGLIVPRIGLVKNPANFPTFVQVRSQGDAMPNKERKTIEIPADLVETIRTIGEGIDAARAKVAEAPVVRGEKADAMMAAVTAALAALEPLRGQMEHDEFARLAAIAGYNIADLAWIERAQAAIARCEALDAEAEAQRQAAEAQARSEFPLTADGKLDIEKVPESVRSIVRAAWDREQAIIAREADVARREQEQAAAAASAKAAAEEAEVTRALDEIGDLAGDKAKRHATALRAKRTDEKLYADMMELWRQEAAAARAPMGEIGSGAEGSPLSGGRKEAEAICAQRVQKMLDADPKMTRSAAEAKVWQQDPKLYEQYRYDGRRN
jgi:hypothetical protein